MQASQQPPALPLAELAMASIVLSVRWELGHGLQLPTAEQVHIEGIVHLKVLCRSMCGIYLMICHYILGFFFFFFFFLGGGVKTPERNKKKAQI